MKIVQIREANASLFALVDAAESAEPAVITRHGHPARDARFNGSGHATERD